MFRVLSSGCRNGKGTAPATAAHDDLLRRDFTADAPNQVWLTDITEHKTGEGRVAEPDRRLRDR